MSRVLTKMWWIRTVAIVACLLALVAIGRRRLMKVPLEGQGSDAAATSGDAHDHPQVGAADAASIELSDNGLKNIGFQPFTIRSSTYEKNLTLPAMVVERPGRSQFHITAPLTGIVTKIHAVTGEAITPGQLLFELRLTHEELVVAQRDYLRTVENLEIVNREITRLKSLGQGVIAGRRVVEQEYEKQKLEASLHAAKQAMLLHGVSESQIEEIRSTGRLFRSISVRAPDHKHDDNSCPEDHLFQMQQLEVAQGEQVDVGRELAVLADHCELHIEGLAFEDDVPPIRRATEAGRKVTASLLVGDSPGAKVEGLEVLYVADQVDLQSRAFKFYLRLPNDVALDKLTPDGNRFIEWRFKPGQRMQLSVPVEIWEDQWVVPTTAIIDEGVETYVYRQNGNSFDRVPVHVLHRDSSSVVIAKQGALFPGDRIAGKGAYQMHLALKNKLGGGVDPHAGHGH